jgi:hypothetical protein
VKINGQAKPDAASKQGFVELDRNWSDGDSVQLSLPKRLHEEPLPDNSSRVALLWGPLVLAGDLGPEEKPRSHRHTAELDPAPVLVAKDKPLTEWLKAVEAKPGEFRTDGVGRDHDVNLVPFYRLHRRTYAIYWDLFTPEEWTARAAQIAAEAEKQKKLEAATVAYVQPGEMQPERDFNEQGEETHPDRVMGRACRRGSKWFSFDLPIQTDHPLGLVVTYYSDEWRKRTFEILADGQRLAQQTVEKTTEAPHFFDLEYAVPGEVLKAKQKITVKFQATQGNEIAAVFGLRLIRIDAER